MSRMDAQERSGRPPWRVLALLAALSTLFTLCVGEVGLRLAGRFRPPPTCDRPELYTAHPQLGYHLHPDLDTHYEYPEHAPRRLAVHANRDGFRARRELGAPPGKTRLLLLGDSFAFGEGVEEPERFAEQMEALRPDWHIDNLGMTGYGLDLMLRAWRTVGRGLRPEHVLLAVYTDDFRRIRPLYAGAGFRIPRFALVDGVLTDRPYPSFPGWHQLRLAQVVMGATGTGPYASQKKEPAKERALNVAILEALREEVAASGASLSVAFLPAAGDLPIDAERRHLLRAWAAEHGLPFTDLTDTIHAMEEAAFIERNWHYNAAGHEAVARQLVELIAPHVDRVDARVRSEPSRSTAGTARSSG